MCPVASTELYVASTGSGALTSVSDTFVHTAPVGAFAQTAGPFGHLDLAGNVWEWTADWYGAFSEASEPLESPSGPQAGSQRVRRGGGWLSTAPDELRGAHRSSLRPDVQGPDLGFRCAR